MKALLVLLTLACAFGLAALWQRSTLRELHAARNEAAQVAAGTLAPSLSGTLPAGKGVVIVGRPSGAAPLPVPAGTAGAPAAQPAPGTEHEAADFELEVRSGQTLSGIAKVVYGTATHDLVLNLAEYNDLADPDQLSEGQVIYLPARETLGR